MGETCGPNCVLWIERVNSYELKVKKVWYPRFFKTNITGSIVTLAQESGCIIDFSELKIFEIDTWTAPGAGGWFAVFFVTVYFFKKRRHRNIPK